MVNPSEAVQPIAWMTAPAAEGFSPSHLYPRENTSWEKKYPIPKEAEEKPKIAPYGE